VDKQLYEALKTIKEHCTSQGLSCKGCQLNIGNDAACDFFDDAPEDWDIEQFETN